jgi:hypothetical protein
MQLDEGYWLRRDDGGRTWGAQRWSIPVRRRLDRRTVGRLDDGNVPATSRR